MSSPISQVLESFRRIGPYFIIVFIGVMAFATAFQALDQIVYVKTADPEAFHLNAEVKEPITPPMDKNMEVTDFYTFKDKWLGEIIALIKSQFISSLIGFEGDGSAEYYTDPQYFLYIACIVFNGIVLINLLIGLTGTVHGHIMENVDSYRYS